MRRIQGQVHGRESANRLEILDGAAPACVVRDAVNGDRRS